MWHKGEFVNAQKLSCIHDGTTPFAVHLAGIPQWQRQLALFEWLTKFNQTDSNEVLEYAAWHFRKNPTHL